MIIILIIIIISIIIHQVRLVNDKNFNENAVSSRTYQSLFLQIWDSTIKNKNRFYPVIQQLAQSTEQTNKMRIVNRIPILVSQSLHWLVKNQTGIYMMLRSQ